VDFTVLTIIFSSFRPRKLAKAEQNYGFFRIFAGIHGEKNTFKKAMLFAVIGKG
jgi:hypothetical protein